MSGKQVLSESGCLCKKGYRLQAPLKPVFVQFGIVFNMIVNMVGKVDAAENTDLCMSDWLRRTKRCT